MKYKTVLIFLILLLQIFLPSCKKNGHAILTVIIQNEVVEYKFWSISYEVKWKEVTGHDCNVIKDELSIIDKNGDVLYSRSYPVNIFLPGCASGIEEYSGILIGVYFSSPKPVKLRHTAHYSDANTGTIYTASDEIVIHE